MQTPIIRLYTGIEPPHKYFIYLIDWIVWYTVFSRVLVGEILRTESVCIKKTYPRHRLGKTSNAVQSYPN